MMWNASFAEISFTVISLLILLAYHGYLVFEVRTDPLKTSIGLRGYYLAIPLALWLFGPTWFLIGTFILVIVLFKLDRMP